MQNRTAKVLAKELFNVFMGDSFRKTTIYKPGTTRE
jgi:hypothetical protein